jgi:TFIIF-interacting CTD phosphatase-like protein
MIKHRLYRQHCDIDSDGNVVKDLSKLGRRLSRTVIVDNLPENFARQPENGIEILTWTTDAWDTELQKLQNQLMFHLSVNNKPRDIRDIISLINIKKND